MPAETYNITIEVGADYALDLEWRQADGTTPVNLTGYTARMQVRLKHTSDDPPLLSLTSGGGGITLGGAAGTIEVRATAAQTGALPQSVNGTIFGVYDLELVLSGVVTRLVQGVAKITSEVTR